MDGPDSQRQVRSMFEECSKTRETITITLASNAQTSLWITCPYCAGITPVDSFLASHYIVFKPPSHLPLHHLLSHHTPFHHIASHLPSQP